MLMRRQALERMLLVLADVGALMAAWFLARALLMESRGFDQAAWAHDPAESLPITHIISMWIPLALWFGLYQISSWQEPWERIRNASRSAISVAFAVVCVTCFWAEAWTPQTRSFVLALAALSFVTFTLSRLGTQGVARMLAESERAGRGVAVVGCDMRAFSVLEHLRMAELGSIRGLIVPDGQTAEDAGSGRVLGSTRELAELINREKLDRIVIFNDSLSEGELDRCSEISARMGVTMSYAVAVAEPARNMNYSVYYGLSLLEIEPVAHAAGQRMIKRAIDIVGSSLLLLILAPLMLLITVLVKATSSGPVLYTAPRVGRGGRYFAFLKFRTMYTQSSRADVLPKQKRDGHIFKMKDDPRVTPIGKFLRRYSLDELPQLVNVLLGEMSLVGPRPLPIEDMDPDGMSRRFAIWSAQRASVPPGITGLWQIRGRSELPFADLIKCDLEYIHNWSLGLDIEIMLKTPQRVFAAKGAY